MTQRKILFRAWDKKLKHMFAWEFPAMLEEHIPRMKDLEWMQYTGLKDKNGQEIYEGDVLCVFDEDIVRVTDEGQGPIEPCNHLVPVEMRNGVWGFEIPKTDDGETGWHGLYYWNKEISNEGYEIIGNVYEHPDLLK